ncbi:acyl CoA binding protein [Dictyocaulus viviparus]|uniref:Acyl CoA binding protein n=1 Tax=Dictyocaulus viviparus TaxID=29172 RepID=A0A0D8XUT9_DICVI|nr:acyl CoA binding protein [Dictyocaulus viviparus]
MPLSELEKKWTGMDFNIAAEEMRRLKNEPSDNEKLNLYGLYKQAIHGDIPSEDCYEIPTDDDIALKKYNSWASRRGQSKESARAQYVQFAEEMIRKYHRHIVRCKWNSEVWSVDY